MPLFEYFLNSDQDLCFNFVSTVSQPCLKGLGFRNVVPWQTQETWYTLCMNPSPSS